MPPYYGSFNVNEQPARDPFAGAYHANPYGIMLGSWQGHVPWHHTGPIGKQDHYRTHCARGQDPYQDPYRGMQDGYDDFGAAWLGPRRPMPGTNRLRWY